MEEVEKALKNYDRMVRLDQARLVATNKLGLTDLVDPKHPQVLALMKLPKETLEGEYYKAVFDCLERSNLR